MMSRGKRRSSGLGKAGIRELGQAGLGSEKRISAQNSPKLPWQMGKWDGMKAGCPGVSQVFENGISSAYVRALVPSK